jgi:hypothetical protein
MIDQLHLLGTRADQTHFPFKDVDHLRVFIEMTAAQPFAPAGERMSLTMAIEPHLSFSASCTIVRNLRIL